VRGTEFEIRTPNLLTRSPALSIAKNALCAVKWKVRPKLRFSSWGAIPDPIDRCLVQRICIEIAAIAAFAFHSPASGWFY